MSADIPRGTCLKCGRHGIRLLKDGTVGLHHDPRVPKHSARSPRCKGWGKPPAKAAYVNKNGELVIPFAGLKECY